MNLALLTIILALVWAMSTGTFTLLNLIFGALIALAALYLLRERIKAPRQARRMGRILALAGLFLRELVVSGIRVSILVLTPDLKKALSPAFIAFPLRVRSDAEITLLANLITLTPGTLSVDISADKAWLFIHVLQMSDKATLVAEIANGFETRVMEVFA
jgi:multicomponent Na+:H+ antiporter subunit E